MPDDGCAQASSRLLLALCAALAAAKEAAPEAADPALEARMTRITAELRCLVCQNQTIADSNAGLAVDLRRETRAMLRQGKSDAEIVAYMTARYGDFVLYRPPLKRDHRAALVRPGGDAAARRRRGARHRAAAAQPKLAADAFEPDEDADEVAERRRCRRSPRRTPARRGTARSWRQPILLAAARGRLQQLKSLHDAGRSTPRPTTSRAARHRARDRRPSARSASRRRRGRGRRARLVAA